MKMRCWENSTWERERKGEREREDSWVSGDRGDSQVTGVTVRWDAWEKAREG